MSIPLSIETITARQNQALALLASGILPPDVFIAVDALNSVMLWNWRKDADFVIRWDEAKAAGKLARQAQPKPRPSVSPLVVSPTVVSPTVKKKPVTLPAVRIPAATPTIMPDAIMPVQTLPSGALPSGATFMCEDPEKKYVVVLAPLLMSQADAHAHAIAESNRSGLAYHVARVTCVAAPVNHACLHSVD